MTVTILCQDGENDFCEKTEDTILQAIHRANVFSAENLEDGRFQIQESCDEWSSVILTKEQFLSLLDELRTLADS